MHPFNFARLVTSENTKFLKAVDSPKSFNHQYRVEHFHKWQKYMFDQAFVIPTTNEYKITAVNSKLTGYSVRPSDSNDIWFKVAYAK